MTSRKRLERRGSPWDHSGFTLTELLIAVGIISIIAALAIPSLIGSKIPANESTAITYLRSWTAAQELYCMRYGVYADADNQLYNDGLIDGHAPADSHGYTFSLDNPPGSTSLWWGRGWPDTPGVTGNRWFYIDQTGVIRYSTSGQANASSLPLGQ